MRYRNLLYITLFFSLLLLLLCWLLGTTPGNIQQALTRLKTTLRTNEEVLFYVTVVYAVCLSIPYIPGGLGLFIVAFTGFKGALYFMAGTLLSLGTNFVIGRRYPIVMRLFKRILRRKLRRKSWWPEEEGVSIFLIIEYYLDQDPIGKKIKSILDRLPFGNRVTEKTIIFLLLITPINVVVGGGGGAALVCGEESRLPLIDYLKIVFWAHLLYVSIPLAISCFIP